MTIIDLPALADLPAAHTKSARVLVALAGPPGSGKTYIGRKDDQSPSKQRKGKPYLRRKPGNFERTVVALVERGGSVRSFHVESATVASVRDILSANVGSMSVLYTDESRLYPPTGIYFADHRTAKHLTGEYVRYEGESWCTPTRLKNVFSVLKRGMHGVYQHCGEALLSRYLAEFDFRYNRRSALGIEDQQRTEDLLRGASASASPIGGLVEPRSPKHKARALIRAAKRKALKS